MLVINTGINNTISTRCRGLLGDKNRDGNWKRGWIEKREQNIWPLHVQYFSNIHGPISACLQEVNIYILAYLLDQYTVHQKGKSIKGIPYVEWNFRL